MIGQNYKAWQILIHRAEGVTDPASHPWKTGPIKPGRLEERPLAVNTGFAYHVVDESDVIHNRSKWGHNFAERFPTLAVGAEFPDRTQPRPQAILEGFHVFAEVRGLTMPFDQFWLVIEEIEVAGASGHEQLHDPFGFRGMMEAAIGSPLDRLRTE